MSGMKNLVPILLAAVIGLVGALVAYKWLQSNAGGGAVQGARFAAQDTSKIVVVNSDLLWGTKLTDGVVEENLVMRPYLKESLPPGHFLTMDDVRGRVLRKHVEEGEPLLESDLAPVEVNRGGLGALIRPGYRAMTVKGDSGFGVTGFIEPGDHVDVLVTLRSDTSGKTMTKIVLENVTVLATGNRAGERREDSGLNGKAGSQPDKAYTLEVSPQDGEKLALAASSGKLHFAMRHVLDKQEILTKGATVGDTLDSFLDAPPPAPPKPKAKARTKPKSVPVEKIEIIKGTSVSTVTF